MVEAFRGCPYTQPHVSQLNQAPDGSLAVSLGTHASLLSSSMMQYPAERLFQCVVGNERQPAAMPPRRSCHQRWYQRDEYAHRGSRVAKVTVASPVCFVQSRAPMKQFSQDRIKSWARCTMTTPTLSMLGEKVTPLVSGP
ncbi:hypothetical protein MCOR19_005848 [Pyricularia oryzae]|uniref:Uncharacterized protein n=2 Tax=Pyricularia TaxID=48558 RepID=A0ABQ8NW36_PYRGI|nr:hypothetical protein MCOR19_005848 [Pyricularia oryzae]KAI6302919.1 hypothetical protein MCOR33_001829 [Pyricularia grisea]QBZ64437.1 hypothetical protein PoMZ_06135 [Pyricularia oryzae]